MAHPTLFSLLAAIAALLSVGMWVDYFRSIDVFEREKPWPLIIAMVIGGCSPFLSLSIYRFIAAAGFHENGELINDLFYAIFCIGLNEELSKLLAVLVVFKLLKKFINEPVDYLIYAGVTALGFAIIENYRYFLLHGLDILSSRTFYSALEHIINTTLIIYGIYRFQLFKKGSPLINSLIAITVAVASHGLFDFFLSAPAFTNWSVIGSILIYLVGINFWAQMLNNANNFSKFFNYERSPVSSNLVLQLLLWYCATVIFTFIVNALFYGADTAVPALLKGLFSDGLLFFIVIIRVSRFRISQGVYLPVKLQLPFYVTSLGNEDVRVPLINLPIKVRGENFREYFLTKTIAHVITLQRLNDHDSNAQLLSVRVQQKLLLKEDQVLYRVTFTSEPTTSQRIYFLKSQDSLFKVHQLEDEICGLYYLDTKDGILDPTTIQIDQLVFTYWYKPFSISS